MSRPLPVILTKDQAAQLEKWSRGGSTPYRLVIRSRIVLLASYGHTNRDIARILRTNPITVARWRSRFVLLGIDGIRTEAPRYGSPPPVPEEVVQRIIRKTLEEKPRGRSHWSTRSLAREVGVSHSTVRRIWKAHDLRPGRSRVALLAQESQFRPKDIDLVGVYVNPPQRAVAISLADRSTSSRKPWALSAPEGVKGYHRADGPWVMDLVSGLNVLERPGALRTSHRHRDQEFLSFLRSVWEHQMPKAHIVLFTEVDDSSSSPHLDRWLRRHPQVSTETSTGPESWKQKVLDTIRQATDGRSTAGTPAGLPDFLSAVARWKQKSDGQVLPFAWTEESPFVASRPSRARGRDALYP